MLPGMKTPATGAVLRLIRAQSHLQNRFAAELGGLGECFGVPGPWLVDRYAPAPAGAQLICNKAGRAPA